MKEYMLDFSAYGMEHLFLFSRLDFPFVAQQVFGGMHAR